MTQIFDVVNLFCCTNYEGWNSIFLGQDNFFWWNLSEVGKASFDISTKSGLKIKIAPFWNYIVLSNAGIPTMPWNLIDLTQCRPYSKRKLAPYVLWPLKDPSPSSIAVLVRSVSPVMTFRFPALWQKWQNSSLLPSRRVNSLPRSPVIEAIIVCSWKSSGFQTESVFFSNVRRCRLRFFDEHCFSNHIP